MESGRFNGDACANVLQSSNGYEFSSDWFSHHIPVWDRIISKFIPRKILEVGCYEGRSTCYLIESCAKSGAVEMYCVDSWMGGMEHAPEAMKAVECRFDRNVALALKHAKYPCELRKMKGISSLVLPHLISTGHAQTFDLAYIDGSHRAPDVLTDAVMSFQLLRVGGLMVFDDYPWHMEPAGMQDLLNMPKPAIDAFLNLFQRRMRIIKDLPLYQLYLQKTAHY